MSLVRKRLKLVFHPEPEALPGPGSVWSEQKWAGTRAQDTGHGPKGRPSVQLKAGHLENEFEFWPDFTIELIPMGPAGLFSFL